MEINVTKFFYSGAKRTHQNYGGEYFAPDGMPVECVVLS